jgi:hypothetical protein
MATVSPIAPSTVNTTSVSWIGVMALIRCLETGTHFDVSPSKNSE